MISIFFDLETTTTNFIGQILNYSFIATDDDFNIIDECSGDVKISPLELPEPLAILANKVDVISHQAKNPLNEALSMRNIALFIEKMIAKNNGNAIHLIGYNSSKFDIPYLRTSMIRNGIQPYFGGKIAYKDLLFLVRKLSCVEEKFIRTSKKDGEDENKLSLTLETTCQNYDILLGKQTHTSRDDVILTINLAKKLLEEFNADIRNFNAYELPTDAHLEYKNSDKIFTTIYPEYDLNLNNTYCTSFYSLLDFTNKNSLWIDLEDYKKRKEEGGDTRKSIKWYSTQSNYLFLPPSNAKIEIEDDLYKIKKEADKELGSINLENYFSPTSCDIEQDIYRIPINLLKLLEGSIWEKDFVIPKELKSKELNIVLSRFKLKNIDWNSNKDEKKTEYLGMYAKYRYGGENKLLLNKFASKDSQNKEDYHKSYFELLEEIQKLKVESKENKEDLNLLLALENFYKESYIAKFF